MGAGGCGFGSCLVGDGRGGVVEGVVGSMLVVGVDEGVDLGLELGDRVGGGSGAEVLLQGLLEAFDLAAGGRVAGSAVLLGDAALVEFGFEGVAAAAAGREPDRVDHAVVGLG